MKNCFFEGDILIPQNVDMGKWSVVACDQYTSEREYWDDVENIVGDTPSTLRIMLPEIELTGDTTEKIAKINQTMKDYGNTGLFKEHKDSMIYVERKLSNGNIRCGLMGVIDLECYDYNKGATTLVRASEGTVLDRLPPRVKIRKDATYEMPHVMVLYNDPQDVVLSQVKKNKDTLEKAYDFTLMKKGGEIKGYFLDKNLIEYVKTSLENICPDGDAPLLFAVGDGNHSLATAKQCYENLKKELSPEEVLKHPSRYALVEIVNIHDKAIEFEPIYRVIFNVNADELISKFDEYYGKASGKECHEFEFITKCGVKKVVIKNSPYTLPVGTLQKFLDEYLPTTSAEIDYIHGEDVVNSLSQKDNTVGILFEGMSKDGFFKTVTCDGALPRKTFSMGEAHDKRFYLECRKIK